MDGRADGNGRSADRAGSPRERFITVYGRKPVLEALADRGLAVDKVLLADNATGPAAREILSAARDRDVPVRRAAPERIKLIAGNGKQDQGVLADVVAPRMRTLADALATERRAGGPPPALLLLDGVTTPANVGMILRTATAAGLDGVVLPRRGVAGIDPLVVKASAGVAFRAPVLHCATALEAAERLTDAGYTLVGLDGAAERTVFEVDFDRYTAFVLGSETAGVSDELRGYLGERLRIPMSAGVESLNVASAAAVLCFEYARRRLAG